MIKDFWLITNYSCNNRCKWCYTQSKNFVNEPMSLDYAKEVMKEMKRIGAVKCTLVGGEPTVYPHLFDLIEYGNELGLFMKIVTNAVLLSDNVFVQRLKDAKVSLVAISIHGGSPQTYKTITQTDKFEDVISGIKNCIEKELSIVTLTTVNKLNQHELFDIGLMLNKLGVENIVYNIAVPTVANSEEENLALTPPEIARTIEANYLKFKEKEIKVGFYATIPVCIFDEDIFNKMLIEKYVIPITKPGGCNIYDSSGFAIDPWGKIIPCAKRVNNVLINTKDENGNFMYANKGEEVWGKIKSNFGIEAWKYPSEKCSSCKKKAVCIGGCPLFWEVYDPNEFIK